MDRNLRSSSNYIWNTSAVLGKGATSSVYQGMSKHTGELVAIKVFNPISHMRPYDVQRREYEVLSKVNHENIVRLLAIEEENENQHKVLVMELCTGGSLFNILDDPSNSFGLEETEFLLVLNHLTAGMKHLRDMNIIHRDLKPGNIMKYISDDGQSIYKLTDFGAARELEEDQQFVSLYGTEEYLHPELYAKAVLKKPAVKSFSAKVDLWSIGVTLFHLATGSLPFRPYGGRKNREMMHRITTEKQQGIISGIQHSDNGDIEWNSNLPKTCLLSRSLQSRITPLLAGLLEYNPKNMWTFDRFFESVLHVSNHKAVYVFSVNNISHHTFYVLPNEQIGNLKSRLADVTQIPIECQLVIWNKNELTDKMPVVFSSPDNPMILLNIQATSIKPINLIVPNQFKFPEILKMVTGEHDAQQSKACSSIAYCIARVAAKCLLYGNIIDQVPQQVMSRIEMNVKLLNEKKESCSHLIAFLKDKIEFTAETMSNLHKCMKMIDPKSDSVPSYTEADRIRESFSRQLETTWKELLPKIVDISKRSNNLADRWHEDPSSQLEVIKSAKAKIDYLCSIIKDSWLFLHKNKSSRLLGGNENQLQDLEKLRIDSNCKKVLRLLHEDSNQTHNELIEKLDDWYNDAHVILVQSGCLMGELTLLMDNHKKLQDRFEELVEFLHKDWATFNKRLIVLASGQQDCDKNLLQTGSKTIRSRHENFMKKLNNQTEVSHVTSNTCSQMDQIKDIMQHNPSQHLMDEIQTLNETCKSLYESLSENQNLFSDLVAIITPKSTSNLGQY